MATNTAPLRNTLQITLHLYDDELDAVDLLVTKAKDAGGKYANRTRLIRIALSMLQDVPMEKIVEHLARMPASR